MSTFLPAIHRSGGVGTPPLASSVGGRLTKDKPSSANHGDEHERTLADEYFDRIYALETENERFRVELRQVRSMVSNNMQLRDEQNANTLTTRTPLSSQHHATHVNDCLVHQDMDKLQFAFTSKAQSDAVYQEKEKQKAALLFGEVVRLGKLVESIEVHMQQQHASMEQRLQAAAAAAMRPPPPESHHPHGGSDAMLKDHGQSIDELRSLVASVKSAMTQIKTDIEVDRNERWKMEMEKCQHAALARSDATVATDMELRFQGQLDRLTNRVAMDKSELLRLLDEQRDAGASTDTKRATQAMHDTKRLSDHVVGLEQLVTHELKSMGQLVQGLVGDWDNKFRALADQVASEVTTRSGAWQQLDDDVRTQMTDLHDATRDVTAAVQTRLRDLEDIVPMEIQARQKGHEKLKRRVDAVAKSVTSVLDKLQCDVDAGRTASTLRMNAFVATQLELAEKMDALSTAWTARLKALESETHVALTNALHATAQEYHQRLAAGLDVADAVARLQQSTDDRFELVRVGWANLDARTQATVGELHAQHQKAMDDIHARLLLVHGVVDKAYETTTAKLADAQNAFQGRLDAVTATLAAAQTQHDATATTLQATVAAQLRAAEAVWTAQLEDVDAAAAVQSCLLGLVARVADGGAADTAQYLLWNTEQSLAWQAEQFNQALALQADVLRATVADVAAQQAQAAVARVGETHAGIEARWYEDMAALRQTQARATAQVGQVQETLVRMAWNIEERSIQDAVADVLGKCVATVEGSERVAALAAHIEDVATHMRHGDGQVTLLRTKLDQVRQDAAQKDECENLRIRIAALQEQLDALVLQPRSTLATDSPSALEMPPNDDDDDDDASFAL
ncbi:Aste57867_22025 [Aphanomyces stellatus]|uniref:Aste57867_22025 protein n=1 Tax=Aphanomyces stellatus TaxID=120398 RepID=A0A485LJ46_9STRA|nr:hypothetical protein As57867_021956 [Aphanomyces stellatus]VFT98693.1 Aste57867_22025 [Aphanomyces stellatus]